MTDESAGSVDASSRFRRSAQLAGRAAAVLGTVSLAGCSLSGSDGEPTTSTPRSTPDGPTESGPDVSAPDASAELSAAECFEALEQVDAEIEAIHEEIMAMDGEIVESTVGETDPLEARYDRWQTAPADVVNTAKAVGIDARPAVVYLDLDGSGLATGWYVDDHHVLTNAHNVFHAGELTESITAWTLDGDERPADLLGYVESNTPDVAVLRTDAAAPATLSIGESALATDQYVLQVGHPGGVGNWLTSLGQYQTRMQFQTMDGTMVEDLVTSVPGRSGVSGSPLLDLSGNVVGMAHGGQDIASRSPDTAPAVAPDVVYDRPMAPRQESLHVPIEVVVETAAEWR